MAVQFACNCGQQFVLHQEHAGQTVRCPQCDAELHVPDAGSNAAVVAATVAADGSGPSSSTTSDAVRRPGPPPLTQLAPPDFRPPALRPLAGLVEVDSDAPILEEEEISVDAAARDLRKQEKMRARQRQLQMTGLGLTLTFWSIVCLLGVFGTLVVLAIFVFTAHQIRNYAEVTGNPPPPTLEDAGPLLAVLTFTIFAFGFLQGLLYLVGSALCCWVPRRSRARPYVVVSVSLLGASFGLMVLHCIVIIVALLLGHGLGDAILSPLPLILSLLAFLLFPGGFVLFMLFLRGLAVFLNERSTGDEVLTILVAWIVLFVVSFPLSFICWTTAVYMPFAGGWIGALLLAFWYAFWVREWVQLLNVVGSLRRVIDYEFGV
jgi:hypothetical protein